MSKAALVLEAAPAAYLQQFNRLAAGSIATAVETVGAGTFTIKIGAGVVYGFIVTLGAAGTISAYDSVTATGKRLLNNASIAATNNVFIPVCPGGVGVQLDNGLTIVVTGASTILSVVV